MFDKTVDCSNGSAHSVYKACHDSMSSVNPEPVSVKVCSKNVFGLQTHMGRTRHLLAFVCVVCCLLAGLQTTHQAEICSAGYYGLECTACPGSSTGAVGAMSREDCTCNAGYFGTECGACAPGSYTPAPNNAAECVRCARGTYSDIMAQAQCQPCPGNQTTVHVGADSEDTCVCESGTFQTADGDSGGSGVCVACPAGTYYTLLGVDHLADKNNVCILCERGTYSDTVGAASRHDCRACAAGTFMPTQGASSATSCELCAAGTYSFGVLELLGPGLIKTWTDAGINQWVLGKHGENCVQTCRAADMRCVGAEGFPQLLSRQTTRALFAQNDTQCRGGVENSTSAAAPCMSEHRACFRGVGTSTCNAADVGLARMCPCADNAFLGLDDDLGSPRLVDWAKDGLRQWKLANPKQNCHTTCSGESLVCTSRGNFVAKTLTNSDLSAVFAKLGVDCRQFLPGISTGQPSAVRSSSSYGWLYSCKTHSFNPNTYQCEAASIQWNEYQLCFCSESHDTVFPTIFRVSNETRVGATTCTDCVAGKYSASSGQPACDLCARGTYSGIVGATGQEMCAVCVPGTHTLEAGRTLQSECVPCAKGTHKAADGMLVCETCDLGKFSAQEALPECAPCSADTYADTAGQTSCVACFPGKFVSQRGSATSDACVSCLSGKYVGTPLNTTTQRCLGCPPGTYSDAPGMTTCLACRAGTYQANPEAIGPNACLSCEPGKFSGSIGDRVAESVMQEGRFAQGIEQWLLGRNGESCVAVCDAAGLTCSNGDEQPWPQQLARKDAKSLFQLHNISCLLLGDDSADASTAPFVSDGVNCYTGAGHSTCETASQQHARLCPCRSAAGSDSAVLLNAQALLEQPYVGASVCLLCAAGTYLGTAGNIDKHQCVPCGRGNFSSKVGAIASSTCHTCPAGSFAGNLATSVCSLCPMGTFSAEASVSVCTTCNAGSYLNATGAVTADACVLCDVGKYSSQDGNTKESDCLQCRAGTYSDTAGSSSCVECRPGTFLAIEGSDASTSEKQCSECAAGKYSGTLLNRIQGSQLHAWATTGIQRWIVGRAGDSCDAVCHAIGLGCSDGPANHEATSPLWQGSVQFPQGLAQTTTDVLFLQNNTNCEHTADSEHPSAPYVSNRTHCHRGVGTSSCSALAPTHSRLCPCSTFPLINFVGIVDIATAWRWARLGVRSWKLAQDGDSCSVSCNQQEQQCTAGSNRAQFLTQPDQDDLYGHLGIDCAGKLTYSLNNIVAPLVNEDGLCRSAVSASRGQCLATAHGRRRVCACGVASFDSKMALQMQNPNYPGASTCLDCVPGTFLATQGNIHRSACELCGKGTFSAASGLGASACQSCRAGTFSSLLGQTSNQTCTACVAGKYAATHGNTAESNCTQCPAGTYSGAVEATSAESCVSCGAGTYQAGSGATAVSACTACGAGKYSAQIGGISEGVCVSCVAGTWSQESGMSSGDSCVLCAVGTFSSALGASSASTCLLCGPGKYMSLEGANAETQCELCGSGKYLPGSGSTSAATCRECGEGKYGLTTGSALESSCVWCVSGKISNVTGAQSEATCTDCALGKYRVNTALQGETYTACVECAAGTFAHDTGSSVCAKCAAGNVSTGVGATSPDTCVKCALGKYVSVPGSAVCILCAAGSFAAREGLTTCTLCASGKYSTALEAGTQQEHLCVQCPIATYSELQGQTSNTTCSPCPPGTYSEHGGLARRLDCLDCLGGTFSDTPGATMCATCGVGTYSAENTCTPCLAGKYLNTIGNSNAQDCIVCAEGKYSSQDRASVCESCVSGTYSNSTGNAHADTCRQCLAGTFAANTGSTVCTECTAGKISTDVGAASPDTCIKCASGKYVSSPGSVACNLCAIGSYAALQGLETCTLCASGKYSIALETGAVHAELCVQCPAQTTPNPQHTNCTCNAGSTRLHGGNCTYCVPGKFKATTGAKECTECNVGHFSASVGAVSDVCQACAPNANAPAGSGHSTACTCNAGSSGPDGGNCTQCLPGKYKVAAGADPNECSECTTGKYSPTVGAASSSVCQQCPAASDAPSASPNQQQCKCNMGWAHHAPFPDPAQGGSEAYCQACTRATYTSTPGSQRCINCTPAQYLSPLYAPTQYSPGFNRTNSTVWRMCTVQTFALHKAVNTNVRFQLQRESPCTVRSLLGSAANWTIGDEVRINYPQQHHPTPNPPVLRYMATEQSNMGPVLQWSPINVEPIHTTNTTYTITLQNWPLLLTLDAYEDAMIVAL